MKAKVIFAVLSVSSILFSSCKKYEEGPALSLRSKSERVSNNWKVSSYTVNGVDFTSLLTNENYTETFDKEGVYSFNANYGSGSGKWEFQANNEQIKRSGVSSQSTQTLFILKLKERHFWYYFMDGNDKHEFHLEEN